MGQNTGIQWTDHTFNPWWGCQKVSPGCDHCYAETLDKRTGGAHWGPGAERRRTSAQNWNQPRKWNREAEKTGTRPRVFCASMADVFDNAVPQAWRDDLWQLIRETPNLRWQLLTKRIGNAVDMLPVDWPQAFPHVGVMISVVNQEEADRDVPKLMATPAAWRGLSMEPLLGPVDLWGARYQNPHGGKTGAVTSWRGGIDWVIVGGESGAGARPMHPVWAKTLRDQCSSAGVPFFFKQWGEWAPGECSLRAQTRTERTASYWNDKWHFGSITLSQGVELHCDDEPDVWRFGKKGAGRWLDGREWNEFPLDQIEKAA